eukprot:gene17942-biopygen11455
MALCECCRSPPFSGAHPGDGTMGSWDHAGTAPSLPAPLFGTGELTPLQIAERTEGIIGWALFDRDPIKQSKAVPG